ncbi:DNA-processing protein DprA [Aestuariirhabdus sp. Z084]|uniref:DNA-processing protein DprA n=1 Tax=Aestuariirhabdus haliotis TaxID=2918751 RepID=UPI00201B459A|nr:DNA-processing protein DprA [Aestuariirhabdus haliotis]MCL6414260.1 DNA-processing protein DprA [Aestuariirhabdus haliotis]MCL6418192.1 DNA-processing protein DprA [Aestuariirhabdus haliotis]
MDTLSEPWERLVPWLLLHLLPQLGPIRSQQLLRVIEHPSALLDHSRMNTVPGLPAATARALKEWHQQRGDFWQYGCRQLERTRQWLNEPGNHVLCLEDDAYPELLRQLPDPPPLLYVRGQVEALLSPQIAVVGSRQCSYQGAEIAFEFAYQLSLYGLTMTSGLARGIDTQAHRGALKAQAPTLAVLGTGIDRCYPAENSQLAAELVDTGGALISEFCLGLEPRAGNFPRRNRVISGLSRGILVVEAGLKSGTLITARLAMEQNREVFAIPGSIRNSLSAGCHQLIREGATLVDNSEGIIAVLAPQILPSAVAQSMTEEAPDSTTLGGDEQQVLGLLDGQSCCLDLLVVRSAKPVTELMLILQRLEVAGWVRRVPGGYERCY